jgi:hypothetical protein
MHDYSGIADINA